MSEDMPDRMPEKMSEDMSDKMSDRMPKDMPDRMPEDLPDRMPEDMPEDMPDRMPDRMPEDMSDRMPEDLPVRKCINVMVGIIRSEVSVSLPEGILKPPLNHILPPQDSRQASHRHLLTPSLLGRDAAKVAFQVGHLRNGT